MWELLTGEEPYSDMCAAKIIGNVKFPIVM
jgi:hypothetical protein